jgi:hypothetical protein
MGPFAGAALAAVYHQVVISAIPFKSSDHYWGTLNLVACRRTRILLPHRADLGSSERVISVQINCMALWLCPNCNNANKAMIYQGPFTLDILHQL